MNRLNPPNKVQCFISSRPNLVFICDNLLMFYFSMIKAHVVIFLAMNCINEFLHKALLSIYFCWTLDFGGWGGGGGGTQGLSVMSPLP